MSDRTSPEGSHISRRDLLRGAAATGALAAAGIDTKPAHALPNKSAELLSGGVTLRQMADSKHLVLGGLGNKFLPDGFESDFNTFLVDGGPLHLDRIAPYPTPYQIKFEKLEDSLKTAKDAGLKVELHHLVRGCQGTDGNQVPQWVQTEITDNGGDPVPVINKTSSIILDHLHESGQLDNVFAISVVNETLNAYGTHERVVYPNGYEWGNYYNDMSANYHGDARHYIATSFDHADKILRQYSPTGERTIKFVKNEWGAELAGTAKGDGFTNEIHYLHQAGVMQDGDMAGYQVHLFPGNPDHIIHPYGLTLANEAEIESYAQLFEQQMSLLPPGISPHISEMSIDESGWRDYYGYNEDYIKYLKGYILYRIPKALFNAGGRSIMLYAPALVARKDEGDPVHQFAQAINELPGK